MNDCIHTQAGAPGLFPHMLCQTQAEPPLSGANTHRHRWGTRDALNLDLEQRFTHQFIFRSSPVTMTLETFNERKRTRFCLYNLLLSGSHTYRFPVVC